LVEPKRVLLLDADRELARALSPDTLRTARDQLVAETCELAPGPWIPPGRQPADHLGYLVLEGMLSREISVLSSRSVELLGPGDLLRPWQEDLTSFAFPSWHVLEPARMAILDRSVAARISRWPELVTSLVERTMARARAMAIHAAIETIVGLEKRLLMLLWHLAERWGRREPEGALLPLRLTHDMIAQLAGARRPSVTTALGSLERSGALMRTPAGYKLLGSPPTDAFERATRAATAGRAAAEAR
jgi:CRP/FNR family transcriptional regulator, cyclic AMP receptor protein